MRVVLLTALTVLLAGCLTRMGQSESGPEQFQFTPIPGSGVGADADALVRSMDGRDASHVASVDTPLGRFDVADFLDSAGSTCRSIIGANLESVACGPPGGPGIGADELRILGTGLFDEWVMVELQGGSNVTTVTATAEDGRIYRAGLLGGFGIIVYPEERGRLSIQAFDAARNPLGEPQMGDAFGAPAPEPVN